MEGIRGVQVCLCLPLRDHGMSVAATPRQIPGALQVVRFALSLSPAPPLIGRKRRLGSLDDQDGARGVVDQVVGDGAARGLEDALLVALARDDEVDTVVGGDTDEGLARVTVEDVQRALVAGGLELLAVGLELLERLRAQCLEELVLLLGVDGQRPGDPGALQHLGGEDRGNKDVCLAGQHLAVQDPAEGLVAGLGAVNGQQDLGRGRLHLLAGHANDLLVARLLRDIGLLEGVAMLQQRCLRHLLGGCLGAIALAEAKEALARRRRRHCAGRCARGWCLLLVGVRHGV